jgi:hypothetical protein
VSGAAAFPNRTMPAPDPFAPLQSAVDALKSASIDDDDAGTIATLMGKIEAELQKIAMPE